MHPGAASAASAVDPALPVTTLQVKLLDGRKERLQINLGHTVSDLQARVLRCAAAAIALRIGSKFSDSLTGGLTANSLIGGSGNDLIIGGGGADKRSHRPAAVVKQPISSTFRRSASRNE